MSDDDRYARARQLRQLTARQQQAGQRDDDSKARSASSVDDGGQLTVSGRYDDDGRYG